MQPRKASQVAMLCRSFLLMLFMAALLLDLLQHLLYLLRLRLSCHGFQLLNLLLFLLIQTTQKIVTGIRVNSHAIQNNMDIYGPFASTERLLMALGKKGADRQVMHERLRERLSLAPLGREATGEEPDPLRPDERQRGPQHDVAGLPDPGGDRHLPAVRGAGQGRRADPP